MATSESEPVSQRIQDSLSQLDNVLSIPYEASANIATSEPSTPPGLLTPWKLSGMGQSEDTPLLRNLHLAPTPILDKTKPVAGHLRLGTLLEDTVLGEDATVVEDPTTKISGDLILSFHDELSVQNRPYRVLDMLQALEKCCKVQQEHLTDFEKQTRYSVDQLQSELCMERATWQLFHVLAHDRRDDEEKEEPPRLDNCRASDKQLAELLFLQDSSVRQAQLVVDWLEGLARAGLEHFPAKAAYFADNSCWENTLHDLTHGTDRGLLITEMDFDAPTRQHRKISGLDAKDELSLNKHLFMCIRAGRLDQALGICVSCGQPLKALMLEGWKLHHDPNVGMLGTENVETMEGNQFRTVWKSSCWQMLEEPEYDVYEKAIFASLSGNVRKILPACQTWYDYVWAYFKTLVDVQVEKAIRRRATPMNAELMALPPEYWSMGLQPHHIFQEIESSSPPEVQQQAVSHFHSVQKYIVLDDMTGLLEEMVAWLPSRPSLHRLRFMAHIGLAVRGLGRIGDMQERQVNTILEEYVKALTEGQYQSAVALYVAQLPVSSQVTSYAHLLAGVRQEKDQRECLELGREAGLDIGMVTKTVVEKIRSSEPDAGTRHVTAVELGQEVEITELDWEKIDSINWLVFEEEQRPEAITQGNALIRQFLTAHKFAAAQAVLRKIPTDSAEVVTRLWQQEAGMTPLPPNMAWHLSELEALQTYLDGIEKFNSWFQYFHHKRPSRPPEPELGSFHEGTAFEHSLVQYELEYEQWQLQASLLAEEASAKLQDVLVFPGGWMWAHSEQQQQQQQGMEEGGEGDGRDVSLPQQLQALRQICIPQVCFLLLSVLHESGLYKKCLQLSDVVTSEKFKLYEDVRPSELRQLLALLQRSALALAGQTATDPLGYAAV